MWRWVGNGTERLRTRGCFLTRTESLTSGDFASGVVGPQNDFEERCLIHLRRLPTVNDMTGAVGFRIHLPDCALLCIRSLLDCSLLDCCSLGEPPAVAVAASAATLITRLGLLARLKLRDSSLLRSLACSVYSFPDFLMFDTSSALSIVKTSSMSSRRIHPAISISAIASSFSASSTGMSASSSTFSTRA